MHTPDNRARLIVLEDSEAALSERQRSATATAAPVVATDLSEGFAEEPERWDGLA